MLHTLRYKLRDLVTTEHLQIVLGIYSTFEKTIGVIFSLFCPLQLNYCYDRYSLLKLGIKGMFVFFFINYLFNLVIKYNVLVPIEKSKFSKTKTITTRRHPSDVNI